MICTTKYYSRDNIKRLIGGTCDTCERERRSVQSVVLGKPDGKRSLRRRRRRRKGNIEKELQGVGRGAWSRLIWLKIGVNGELL